MNSILKYDLVVIGAGSGMSKTPFSLIGGLACAKRAAGYGKKVAIIEKNRVGGTCVNVGCMPKKVMYNAATLREDIHLAKNYGFETSESFDWSILKHKRDECVLRPSLTARFIKRLNTNHANALKKNNVDYFEGFGHFVAPHQVQVSDGVILEGNTVLIATGGKPVIPDFPGNQYCGTSNTFWELETLPKRSLVIGGGYIAVELACILNILGSETFFSCRHDTPLRRYDPFVIDLLMAEMKRRGITEMPNTTIQRITQQSDSKYECAFSNGQVVSDVDFVLMATGRVPLLDGLGLEVAGVQTEHGVVKVDAYQQTTAPGVYCIGDDIGKVDLTPVAIQTGRRLADRLFNQQDSVMDFSNIPSVVFSHPPIATCGLTEARARERFGEDVRVYKTVFSNTMYALNSPEDKPKTGMKLVCQKSTEKVLGVHMIGENVDEMLQGFAVAIKMGATKKDFDAACAIHPTSAEEMVTMAPWGQY